MAAFFVLCVMVICTYVEGWPSGSPVSQCGSMRTGHGVPPMDGDGGYGVFVASTPTPGDWKITLNGSTEFRGFLLQARTETGDEIVGTWISLPPKTKQVSCDGSPGSAVTHSNMRREKLLGLDFVWRADSCDSPPVYFKATVVQTYSQLYEGIKSEVLHSVCVQPTTVAPATIKPVHGDRPSDGAYLFFGQDCLAPREILYGVAHAGPSVVRDGERAMKLIHYSCEEGYELYGDERIECQVATTQDGGDVYYMEEAQDHSDYDHSDHDHYNDHSDHDHSDHDHSDHDHDHSDHDHSDHDHSDHDHSDHDHSDHDHSDHDHDHSDHDHSDHDHDHDHSDHDHSDHDHDHDHSDHDHSDHDHDHDHSDHDHSDHDHDHDHSDHDHSDHDHSDHDHDHSDHDHSDHDHDHSDHDHSDHDHDHDHSDHDHSDHDHDHSDHDHDHDHSDHDHSDYDHSDHDHSDHDHDHDHSDHDHDHDHSDHDHSDYDHSDHDHSDHDHDHDHSDHDHSDHDHDHDHSDHDHSDHDHDHDHSDHDHSDHDHDHDHSDHDHDHDHSDHDHSDHDHSDHDNDHDHSDHDHSDHDHSDHDHSDHDHSDHDHDHDHSDHDHSDHDHFDHDHSDHDHDHDHSDHDHSDHHHDHSDQDHHHSEHPTEDTTTTRTTGMFQSMTESALRPEDGSNPLQKNYGVAVADVDRDGKMEFIVAGYNGPNLVLKWNPTTQKYENIAVDDPSSPYFPLRDPAGDALGVAACDIDGDGWEEIYFLNVNRHYSGGPTDKHRLFQWHQGRYRDLFALPYNREVDGRYAGRSVACIDRKGTGIYSVFVANYANYNVGPQGLIEMDPDTSDPGNGIIRLKNVAREAGVEKLTGGRGVTVGPIVNERNMSDIFCGNERGPNFLFENQGDGTFGDVAERAGILDADRHNDHWHSRNGRGVALADFNGDGLVDIVNGNWMGPHRLWLQHRGLDGTVSFKDVGSTNSAFQTPSPVRTVIANDFDNDGQIEVFFNDIVNWRHGKTAPNRLFTVSRQGALQDPVIAQVDVGDALEPDGYGTGGAVADMNGDGRLELLLAHGESNTQPLTVFRVTQGHNNDWIRIYPTTKFGAPARGSRVTIRTARGDFQLRVVDGGSGYLCQMEPIAHFGLGSDRAVQVEVTWPDGRRFSRELAPNEMKTTVTISHPDAANRNLRQKRMPRCVPVACGEPPSLENGIIRGEGRRFNDTVTYNCTAGFRLLGAPFAICNASKQWYLSDTPRCMELQNWAQVTFSELTSGLTSGDLLVIDVRRPAELQRDGEIIGSINIPLRRLEAALQMSDEAFLRRHGVPKPQLSAGNIVFSCRSGARALRALELARRLGFTWAKIFEGGIREWNRNYHVDGHYS